MIYLQSVLVTNLLHNVMKQWMITHNFEFVLMLSLKY